VASSETFNVETDKRHVFQVPPEPCVVVPLDWVIPERSTLQPTSGDFQDSHELQVLVDGEMVSHGLSMDEEGGLEVAFRVDPGTYEVVIRQRPSEREPEGVVLFARTLEVDQA
jgi:hypothetical protein